MQWLTVGEFDVEGAQCDVRPAGRLLWVEEVCDVVFVVVAAD